MDPSGEIIGKQIAFARAERNLTRQDLGVILGIKSEQLEKYESGKEAMPAGLLCRLSDAFDLPVTAFFRPAAESGSAGRG
ncbi:helix-turn-helix transcriptional regulator [Pelagibius sp. CAU 1746]|uniref:helix-turn-helix domain-containing protein n=1 Tax=Pelagibius sp. CAU 1746 TaxID=3140370 RepID=UPI00325C2653